MSGYSSSKDILLKVEVDKEGILGKIAKIDTLAEELTNEINSLKRMVSISEKAPSDN